MRKWYNVELSGNMAKEFGNLLKDVEFGQGFEYEVSENGELTHFEVYLEEHEVETCNIMLNFLKTLA